MASTFILKGADMLAMPYDELMNHLDGYFKDGCPSCKKHGSRELSPGADDTRVEVTCLDCGVTFLFKIHDREPISSTPSVVGSQIAARAALL